MTVAAVRVPDRLLIPAGCAAAAVFGALVAVKPALAIGLVALAAIVLLAFLLPVAHLALILAVTMIVPYGIQNQYGLAGGSGLVLSDALILVGLLRALMILARQPLERRQTLAMAGIGVMLVIAAAQTVRGWRAGFDVGQVGYEFRVLLGWSTIAIAMPLIKDRAARDRLYRGMLCVGIAVGVYGLLQYFELFTYFAEGQAGLREGVRFTSSGKGQIQGGLFAFPVGVLMGFAVLTSGAVRSRAGQVALLALVGTNTIGLLLTYERTFWVATVLGLGFIAVRSGFAQRMRVVVLVVGVVVVIAPVMSTIAPGALSAASERLLSLNQYGSDDSVRARLQEGSHVIDKIQAHPIVGNGLGDTIFFGLPWLQKPPSADHFTHNGYLWLAWKLGILAAVFLLAVVVWAVVARPPPYADPLHRAVQLGAQAALLVILVVSITFPSFVALNITALCGVLLAICLGLPRTGGGRAATRGP
jgi:hypothetical protein